MHEAANSHSCDLRVCVYNLCSAIICAWVVAVCVDVYLHAVYVASIIGRDSLNTRSVCQSDTLWNGNFEKWLALNCFLSSCDIISSCLLFMARWDAEWLVKRETWVSFAFVSFLLSVGIVRVKYKESNVS